jgi:hypothetical protein
MDANDGPYYSPAWSRKRAEAEFELRKLIPSMNSPSFNWDVFWLLKQFVNRAAQEDEETE